MLRLTSVQKIDPSFLQLAIDLSRLYKLSQQIPHLCLADTRPPHQQSLEQRLKRHPLTCHSKDEPSRDRTCDPLIKSQLLYQLSYRPTAEVEIIRLLTPESSSPLGKTHARAPPIADRLNNILI
jgi:hypothetical protein